MIEENRMVTKEGPNVAIVQRVLPHYRIPFYQNLRSYLEQRGVQLRLLYGQPKGEQALRRDTEHLPWGQPIANLTLSIRNQSLCWQSCLGHLDGVDLIIVEQASRLLVNYVLLMQQALGMRKVAFWGHGKSHKEKGASRIGETLKAFASTRVHWWFAYNARTQRILEKELQFPSHRITDVRNAIDTRSLMEAYQSVPDETVEQLRRTLGIRGANVGLFIGGMYEEKRLPFLVTACHRIRAAVPDCEMLFIGAGADENVVRSASRETSWMHYVKPKFDTERVPYFKLAKVLLMPGLVGLVILDAFCLDTPLVTTDVSFHSPEVDYLEPGVNGILVSETNNVDAYAESVVHLLNDQGARQHLIEGGRKSGKTYSIEDMSRRFGNGIMRAISTA